MGTCKIFWFLLRNSCFACFLHFCFIFIKFDSFHRHWLSLHDLRWRLSNWWLNNLLLDRWLNGSRLVSWRLLRRWLVDWWLHWWWLDNTCIWRLLGRISIHTFKLINQIGNIYLGRCSNIIRLWLNALRIWLFFFLLNGLIRSWRHLSFSIICRVIRIASCRFGACFDTFQDISSFEYAIFSFLFPIIRV